MSMAIPTFLFFSVYCVLNVYLPLFFRNAGYSATLIGGLLGVFEVAGIFFTFLLCRHPAKSGKYGLWLLGLGLLCTLLAFPTILLPLPFMAIALILFAAPVKSIIPISDAFIHLRLQDKSDRYGMIRSFGSLGFVVMSLLMQNCVNTDTISKLSSALWLATPTFLMCLSLVFIPKLLKPMHHTPIVQNTTSQEKSNVQTGTKNIFKQFSKSYWLMILVLTFGYLTQHGSSKFFSLYVKEYLHSDSFSLLWAISVATEIPAMFFSYRFVRKYGSKNLILFSVAMNSFRSFIYVLFPSVGGAAFAQLFHCLTFGFLHPATVIFIAQEVKDAKNAVLGQAISSVGATGFASVVGSLLGGYIIDKYGYAELYTFFGILPLIGLAIYFFLRKKV